MRNSEKFIIQYENIIKEIQIEYEKNSKGNGYIPNSILKKIEKELKQMIEIRNPNIFLPYYPHALVDSYDCKYPLIDLLLEIDQTYERIK